MEEMPSKTQKNIMSEKAILDANFLVAYFDRNDIWHTQAIKIKQKMEKENIEGIILDCVLIEVFSVLCRRFEKKEHSKLAEIIDIISKAIPEDKIVWAYPNITDYYRDILSIIKEYGGILNFHDALIALVAKNIEVKNIVSFDKDFDNIPWLKRINE